MTREPGDSAKLVRMFNQSEHEEIERARRTYGAVLALLRGAGSLWHRTSIESLKAILMAGHIAPNDGRFPTTYPQSRLCFGRHINAVCLFDLDTANEDEIYLHAWKWAPFLTDRGPATVWIEIPRARLDESLISSALEFSGGRLPYAPVPPGEENLFGGSGRYVPTYFPYVEAWHRGPIPAGTFARFVAFGEPDKAIEHRSVKSGPRAAEEIEAIATDWEARLKRRYAASRAAGGINLPEIIKAADALAKARRNNNA